MRRVAWTHDTLTKGPTHAQAGLGQGSDEVLLQRGGENTLDTLQDTASGAPGHRYVPAPARLHASAREAGWKPFQAPPHAAATARPPSTLAVLTRGPFLNTSLPAASS